MIQIFNGLFEFLHSPASRVVLAVAGGFVLGGGVSMAFMQRPAKPWSPQSTQEPQKISDAQAEQKKIDDLKDAFLSNITHDLKSPLGAVVSYTDYILSEEEVKKLTVPHADFIRRIRNQCLRLMALVNNLLDMSQFQAGKVEFAYEMVRIPDIVEKVRNLFTLPAKEQGVSLNIHIAHGEVPHVESDPARIQQVLINLISNALKFVPSGGSIELGARYVQDMRQVLLYVKDTGPGIPASEIPMMFGRFHQVNLEEQKKKRIRGTGLGLAICKGIVEAWGGTIQVQSVEGAGSTFSFTIPVKKLETVKDAVTFHGSASRS
jgi:two-component system sensor histidine kinase ResE